MTAATLRLAVDANALVGGVFSETGVATLTHPGLRLVIAEYTSSEAREHLPHRITSIVRNGQITAADAAGRLEDAIAVAEAVALPVPLGMYQQFEAGAWGCGSGCLGNACVRSHPRPECPHPRTLP